MVESFSIEVKQSYREGKNLQVTLRPLQVLMWKNYQKKKDWPGIAGTW
jgi:hypothetical protein